MQLGVIPNDLMYARFPISTKLGRSNPTKEPLRLMS